MLMVSVSADEMLPLHEERLLVTKRVRKTLVRAARTTTLKTAAVDEDLVVEQIVITHVPIGQVVDSVPPMRDEDGVTVIPVVEEEVVVVRRLILKEEIRFERVRSINRHVETVTLRRQEVTVTRIPVED